MKPHKHKDLIIAWANGAEIEVRSNCTGEWSRAEMPSWFLHMEYRIKPEPKPDFVLYAWVDEENANVNDTYVSYSQRLQMNHHNLRLTFDGETGKLKKAEVI